MYVVTVVTVLLVSSAGDPDMRNLLLRHYPAVIGLPSAAGAALFVVLVLRAAAGPIEFEVLGLKFRGASGPVVLWIPCFLAIVVGILTLWGQTYEPLT